MVDLLVIIAALALGSLIKGVTGMGLPTVAIPVMASFLGPERAVVVMAVPGVISNGWLLWAHRSHLGGTRDLPVLLATGTVGAVGGVWLLDELDGAILSLCLAVVVLVYVVLFLSHLQPRISPRASRVLAPPVGLVAGAMQGAMGISGPVLSTYIHALRLRPQVFVVSLVTLFLVFSAVQVVTLVGVGLLTGPRLGESLLALVPLALCLPLGMRLARRVEVATYQRLVVLVLALSAIKLLVDGLGGL